MRLLTSQGIFASSIYIYFSIILNFFYFDCTWNNLISNALATLKVHLTAHHAQVNKPNLVLLTGRVGMSPHRCSRSYTQRKPQPRVSNTSESLQKSLWLLRRCLRLDSQCLTSRPRKRAFSTDAMRKMHNASFACHNSIQAAPYRRNRSNSRVSNCPAVVRFLSIIALAFPLAETQIESSRHIVRSMVSMTPRAFEAALSRPPCPYRVGISSRSRA